MNTNQLAARKHARAALDAGNRVSEVCEAKDE